MDAAFPSPEGSLPVSAHESPVIMIEGIVEMLESKREEFGRLFGEFVTGYLSSSEGRAHAAGYAVAREDGRRNLDDILAKRRRGEDVTDDVLLRLLPHTDSGTHREIGAWVHVAPAIMGDVKHWYERAHWQERKSWPQVAEAILAFVLRCRDHPEQLDEACREFSESPHSRGFQTGMLSPILNAVDPQAYALVNNKSRQVINYLAGTSHGHPLIGYPATNATARALVRDLAEDMHRHETSDLADGDLFDMFCYWLVGIRH